MRERAQRLVQGLHRGHQRTQAHINRQLLKFGCRQDQARLWRFFAKQQLFRQRRPLVGQIRLLREQKNSSLGAFVPQRLGSRDTGQATTHDDKVKTIRHNKSSDLHTPRRTNGFSHHFGVISVLNWLSLPRGKTEINQPAPKPSLRAVRRQQVVAVATSRQLLDGWIKCFAHTESHKTDTDSMYEGCANPTVRRHT